MFNWIVCDTKQYLELFNFDLCWIELSEIELFDHVTTNVRNRTVWSCYLQISLQILLQIVRNTTVWSCYLQISLQIMLSTNKSTNLIFDKCAKTGFGTMVDML